jgi:hypothetical protein
MEIQIFHHAKNIIFKKKKSSKRNQNPSRYHHNSIYLISSFNTSQNKYHVSKNPHVKIDGPKFIKLVYSTNESKQNNLALVGKAKKKKP